MGSEYPYVKLGDHVELATGPAFKSSNFSEAGTRLARGDNVKEGVFHWGEKEKFWPELTEDLERYLLTEEDVLIGMDGSKVGKNWVKVRSKDLPCLLVQRVARLRAKPSFDSGLLPYVIGSNVFREYVERVKTGTSIPHISGGQIRDFEIPLPPLPEQKAIAHILGSLDDKIELNRRMNATLEGMAQALFKSWFVDFDPVIDNALAAGNPIPDELARRAEVRRQALANGTANREAAKPFPDSFQETESMGWIPEGWEVGAIEDFCDLITSGGTPARMKNEYWEGGNICWFKTGELLDGPLLDSKEKITQAGLDNSSCKLWPPGTILFALYASPTVGRLGVLTQAATANQAAAALIAKPSIGVPFLKQLLLVARSSIQDIAVGSAQQNINQKILKTRRVIKPSDKTAKAYSDHVLALSQQIEIRIKQTQSLTHLRDTLLPKLISGELRLPETEQLTKEALT